MEISHTVVGSAFDLVFCHSPAVGLALTRFLVIAWPVRNNWYGSSYSLLKFHDLVAAQQTICPSNDAPLFFVEIGRVTEMR